MSSPVLNVVKVLDYFNSFGSAFQLATTLLENFFSSQICVSFGGDKIQGIGRISSWSLEVVSDHREPG